MVKHLVTSCGCCDRRDAPLVDRRDYLRRTGLGLGSLALASLLREERRLVGGDSFPVSARPRSSPVRSVILLFMGGGPSHVDTWDPKPELARLAGKDVPESIARNVPQIARQRLNNLYPSPYRFQRHGESGLEASSLIPETARLADDICVLRSMHHTSPVHAPAEFLATTGSLAGERPSLGAWLHYGLGTENHNLPGFVVMLAGENYAGPACWSAGFLPAKHQGTLVKSAEGIPHASLPAGYASATRRRQLDVLQEINRRHLDRVSDRSELEARIESYELAFRMQAAAPEAFDLSQETAEVKSLYGLDRPECAEYGANCLLARRLVERGVRFIQLNQGGWDAHGNLKSNHDAQAAKTDRPIAALLTDLQRRGLIGETLVIWGGEFGRTPTAENAGPTPGRDHSPGGYCVWLAGGGIRGGQAVGATDAVGYTAVERLITPHDLHATILHALGIDQRELYYEHQGRRELVTVNGGQIVEEAFA